MNSIPSNCGNIDLVTDSQQALAEFKQDLFDIPGEPSEVRGGIKYFHNYLCQWAYNVPLKFNWVIIITAKNREYLLDNIYNLGNFYEPKGWNTYNSAQGTSKDELNSVVGCIFAQGVNIPGETINIEHAGITEGSNRGFINAPYVNGRSAFEPLEIGFLETNKSFVDGFLRPWSILVAHKGLIATPIESSIKADITVHHLARKDNSKNIIRKSFVFEDCAPINIGPETLDYSSSSDFPKLQAKFSYSKYYVTDHNI